MAKELMNEAERFLLKHWEESRLLEESMDGVRTKYKEVFDRIIEAVTEAHPELDSSKVYATQFWGSGSIGVGRKSWPGGDSGWPPGFWISNLRLEKLASEDSDQPSVTIYVSAKSAKKCNLDIAAAKAELSAAAQQLLSPEEFERTGKGDSNDTLLRLAAPTKAELLELLADGDGQKFVERFVSLFDLMARFVPTLDKLLTTPLAAHQAN
jgi:hypothetical protein